MKNLVVLKNKQATTTSLIVSEYFGKRHERVMRDIENLKLKLGEHKSVSTKDKVLFNEISIINSQNKKQTIYQMDRDGIMVLVMGFTGDKALKVKLQFIEAFNLMEEYIKKNELEKLNKANHEWLLSRSDGKLTRRAETDVIAIKIWYARSQGSKSPDKYYMQYSNLVNSLVGIGSGKRDVIDIKTLNTIAFLEDLISTTILKEMEKGTYYKEIYKECKHVCGNFIQYINLGNRLEYAS